MHTVRVHGKQLEVGFGAVIGTQSRPQVVEGGPMAVVCHAIIRQADTCISNLKYQLVIFKLSGNMNGTLLSPDYS